MRQSLLAASFAALMSVAPVRLGAQVQVSGMFTDGSLGNFYLALSNFYQAPRREVALLRENNVPCDEMPVVLFISREARVSPTTIIDLRRRGVPWFDIAVRYAIPPDVFLVPGGPPYGRAWGYFQKQGRVVFLRDADIVDSVNVKFLSSYYGMPMDEIRELRSHGASYYMIAENRNPHRNKDEDDSGLGKGHQKPKHNE